MDVRCSAEGACPACRKCESGQFVTNLHHREPGDPIEKAARHYTSPPNRCGRRGGSARIPPQVFLQTTITLLLVLESGFVVCIKTSRFWFTMFLLPRDFVHAMYRLFAKGPPRSWRRLAFRRFAARRQKHCFTNGFPMILVHRCRDQVPVARGARRPWTRLCIPSGTLRFTKVFQCFPASRLECCRFSAKVLAPPGAPPFCRRTPKPCFTNGFQRFWFTVAGTGPPADDPSERFRVSHWFYKGLRDFRCSDGPQCL